MKKFKDNFLLSVIIPVYKQEKTIKKDLLRIKKSLDEAGWNYEIIVVVDGKIDKSYQRAKKTASSRLKVYGYKENQGKGYAIRFGMKKAKGDYIAFIDAGMEINPLGLSMLLQHLVWYDADIIVGSKRHPVSQVDYPLIRKILSWGYFELVKLLFGLKISDTQAGIKVFKKEVLEEILPVLLVKKYAFDIEMLAVAYAFGHRRIFDGPIKFDYQFGSLTKAATLRTVFLMLQDTMAIFYRLKILRYYQKKRLRRKSRRG